MGGSRALDLDWPRLVWLHAITSAALLGAAWIGAAVGYRNAVLLTLGTGVGGALLAEGRLFKGHTLKQGPHCLTRWSASWRNWNGDH